VIQIPASEFAKHFGRYKELAQRESLVITSHGRTSGYFLSEHEYAEYQRLKGQGRRAYGVTDLPQETVISLATARMNPAHDHLNALLSD
jgi:hypothetical protein